MKKFDDLKVGDEVYHGGLLFASTHTRLNYKKVIKKFRVIRVNKAWDIVLEEIKENNSKSPVETRILTYSYSSLNHFEHFDWVSDNLEEIKNKWNKEVNKEIKEFDVYKKGVINSFNKIDKHLNDLKI